MSTKTQLAYPPGEIVCRQCGLIDSYRAELKSNNMVCYCSGCGAFIKNLPQEAAKFHFGKYKGWAVSAVEDLNYLQWVTANVRLSPHMKNAIEQRLKRLRP